MEMTGITELKGLIEKSEQITIITHMRPDGDAIGSSFGMYHFLKRFTSANVRIAINDKYPYNLAFITDSVNKEDIFIYQENPKGTERAIKMSDLIICLDFNALHRTGELKDHIDAATASKVLIDHHLSPDTSSFNLVFSKPESSSACELLYYILKELPQCSGNVANLPSETREALMTGMTTDTNNFNNSVTPATFAMASELIATGVDRENILTRLFNQFGENRLRLLGKILKDLMTITCDGVAYMILDAETLKEYNINEGETEGFVNMPLSIKEVTMSILLKEDEKKARVSIRSKKGTSANRCARLYFNGGGHENAAGGKLSFPDDISDISQAAGYIEKYTHIFYTEDND